MAQVLPESLPRNRACGRFGSRLSAYRTSRKSIPMVLRDAFIVIYASFSRQLTHHYRKLLASPPQLDGHCEYAESNTTMSGRVCRSLTQHRDTCPAFIWASCTASLCLDPHVCAMDIMISSSPCLTSVCIQLSIVRVLPVCTDCLLGYPVEAYFTAHILVLWLYSLLSSSSVHPVMCILVTIS